MESQIKTPESEVLIRFPDCDPFNHLNNSRYIDYFINAREDHLMKYYDLNIYKLAAEQGVSWVVGQNQIAYLKPAFLMEKVIIITTIRQFRERDLLVEMQMWDRNKTQLKSLLWSVFVHFNLKTQKSEIHSEELMKRFKALENPLEKEMSFEERVKSFKP